MSPQFYTVLHLIGLVGTVSGLSMLLLTDSLKKIGNIIFSTSLLVMFVAGFGLIAKLGYSIHSAWISIKLLIWLILAVSVPIIAKRFPQIKPQWFLGSFLLICAAIIVVTYKPFM